VDSCLEEALARCAFNLFEVGPTKLLVEGLTGLGGDRLQAESQVLEFGLGDELGLANERIAVHFSCRAQLTVEAILSVLKARLYGRCQRFNDQAVEVRIVVLDDRGGTTTSFGDLAHQIFVAATAEAEAEDPAGVVLLTGLSDSRFRVIDVAIC